MTATPLSRRSARLVFGLLALLTALVAEDAAPRKDPPDDLPKADVPPKVLKQVTPIYPGNLRMAGLIGQVKVAFIVDETGRVQAAHIQSSNNPWFERPALEAVKLWKFQPATKAGKPVKTRAIQQVQFQLDDLRPQNYWRVPPLKDPEKLPPQMRWKTPPEPVSTSFPLYPFEALRTKQKGHTTIRFVVGPNGRVIDAKLVEATAPEFGHAAMAMIDRWRFKPAKLADGQPGLALLAIEHDFTPNGMADVPVTDEMRSVLYLLEKKPEKIVAWADLDHPPKPLWQHAPVYPTALKEKGESGTAQIEFFVDESGDAQLPRIVAASAPEFGYAAAQAVSTWRFEPPQKGGKAVVTRVQVPLNFTLKDPPAPAGK